MAAAFVPGLLRLEIDDSPEGFFVRDAAALERLQRLELDYGRDRAVRLVVEGDDLWTREGLARLGELEAAAGDPRRVGGGVYGAAGLVRHHRWHLEGWPPPDPAAFRRLVAADPVDRNAGWVGEDGGDGGGCSRWGRSGRELRWSGWRICSPHPGRRSTRKGDRPLQDLVRAAS